MTKPANKKVFIHSKYVCERAKTDARKIATYFCRNGYRIVDSPKKADLIVFNSCGYSNPIAQKCLQEIQKLKQYKAELLVVGGLPISDIEAYSAVFTGKTISHKDLETIDTLFPDHHVKFSDIQESNISWLTVDETTISGIIKKILTTFVTTKHLYRLVYDSYFKTLMGKQYLLLSNPFDIPTDDIYRIEIARGCSFQCSYCAIQKSIGAFRSKPFNTCLKEFESGLNQEYIEFYITAPDPGCYGTDIGASYPKLLDTLTSYSGDYHIVLDGVNPVWLVRYVDELEPIMKKERIVAISIPIQSGNTRVLQLMKRFSDTNKMLEAIKKIKNSWPQITITTSCIVGFPSETETEFQDTLSFLSQAKFDMGFINPISLKPHTAAADIEPKISEGEIQNRIRYTKKVLNRLGYNTIMTKTGGVVFGGNHHKKL